MYKKIFSFNVIAISIGVIGFLSSIITVFLLDPSSKISARWLVAAIWISLTIIIAIVKIAYDIVKENVSLPYEIPFDFKYDSRYIAPILLIRKNSVFVNSMYVTCYHTDNGFDNVAFVGVINNMTVDKCFQVELIKELNRHTYSELSDKVLKTYIIRPGLPIEIKVEL